MRVLTSEKEKETDRDHLTAMQTRCIYCHKEQYAVMVYPISQGKHPCVWCKKKPPKLTVKQYREEYNNGLKEL